MQLEVVNIEDVYPDEIILAKSSTASMSLLNHSS